jgi:hypothetical protein
MPASTSACAERRVEQTVDNRVGVTTRTSTGVGERADLLRVVRRQILQDDLVEADRGLVEELLRHNLLATDVAQEAWMYEVVMSVCDSAEFCVDCNAVVVPPVIFGMLIEDTPSGTSIFLYRSGVTRPLRMMVNHWLTSHAGRRELSTGTTGRVGVTERAGFHVSVAAETFHRATVVAESDLCEVTEEALAVLAVRDVHGRVGDLSVTGLTGSTRLAGLVLQFLGTLLLEQFLLPLNERRDLSLSRGALGAELVVRGLFLSGESALLSGHLVNEGAALFKRRLNLAAKLSEPRLHLLQNGHRRLLSLSWDGCA